jgi:hypothetical protein
VFDPGLGEIPKRELPGPAFSSVVMGSIFARTGSDPISGSDHLKPAQKQTARENPRRIGRTYSWRAAQVKEKLAKIGLNPSGFGHFWPLGRIFSGPRAPMKPTGSLPVVTAVPVPARVDKGQNG